MLPSYRRRANLTLRVKICGYLGNPYFASVIAFWPKRTSAAGFDLALLRKFCIAQAKY